MITIDKYQVRFYYEDKNITGATLFKGDSRLSTYALDRLPKDWSLTQVAHFVLTRYQAKHAYSIKTRKICWKTSLPPVPLMHPLEVMQKLKSHNDADCYSYALSADQNNVLTGHRDGTVRIKSIESGEEKILTTHAPGQVYAIAVAPDGTIATGGEDKTVRVINSDGILLGILKGHKESVSTIAIDENVIVSGSTDGTVRIWERRSGYPVWIFNDLGRVISVTIKGTYIICGQIDGSVFTWGWEAPYSTEKKYHVNEPVYALKTLPSKEIIMAAGESVYIIRNWDRKIVKLTGIKTNQPRHHYIAAAASLDGNQIAAATADRIILWKKEAPGITHYFGGNEEKKFVGVEFLKDNRLAVFLENGDVYILNHYGKKLLK